MSEDRPAGAQAGAQTGAQTIVHLMRHGEVHNPDGVLYGRRPGFRLSTRGVAMAETVADAIADRDITAIVASPLERAQQTAAPLATRLGLTIVTDPRVIESSNRFEGRHFGQGRNALRDPTTWPLLWNPLRPSWGEPYADIASRMRHAVEWVRRQAEGHEAVIVSHQLPIWITRLYAEGRGYLHDPRSRHCTLCSLTSLHFTGDRLTKISYSEPAAHLIPTTDRKHTFSSGSDAAPEQA